MSVLGATEYVAHDVLSIIAYHECAGDFVAGVTENWGSSSGDYPVLPADNARSVARVKDRLFIGFADAGVAEIDLADKADVEKHYTSASDPDLVGDDVYSMTGSLVVGSRSRGATKLRLDWLRGDDPNAEVTEYTYNEANELVSLIEDSEDVTTFGYDANGNMVSRVGPEGTTSYNYNTWDRLVAVNTADGKAVSYGYNAYGLRVLSEDETGERSRYLLDGVHVLAKFDEVGSEQKMWAVNNPTRVDEILSALTPERGKQHYHLDGLGSVTAISDGVQRLMQAERYLAWGGSAASQGNVDQPFMFTGREFDRATGLQYNRARWLDTRLGRWTRKDPLDFKEGASRYIYPNPAPNTTDPLGLFGVVPGEGCPGLAEDIKWANRSLKILLGYSTEVACERIDQRWQDTEGFEGVHGTNVGEHILATSALVITCECEAGGGEECGYYDENNSRMIIYLGGFNSRGWACIHYGRTIIHEYVHFAYRTARRNAGGRTSARRQVFNSIVEEVAAQRASAHVSHIAYPSYGAESEDINIRCQ